MRYGIPVLSNRVAPRCAYAESVLTVVMRRDKARREHSVLLANHSLIGLMEVLSDYHVDTLVCGGISREHKEFLRSRNVGIIDNVVGTVDELLAALCRGSLRSGFGLASADHSRASELPTDTADSVPTSQAEPVEAELDCLTCTDRVCLRGRPCELSSHAVASPPIDRETAQMLEAALDISSEAERTLCRLSELVYFCLEMRYRRIGVAYCIDLQEPAEILVNVLRRFFDVFPVSCKVGGKRISDPMVSSDERSPADRPRVIACNPRGQAAVLNGLGTDLNVQIGLCMGADCVFSTASEAPVSTLFVKDKSLANNPIGAVYSDYYLNEATQASPRDRTKG